MVTKPKPENELYWQWRARTGRPTKLDEELKNKIITYIERGNYLETSVQACGVSKKAFYNWLKRGNDEIERLEKNPDAEMNEKEKIYVDFLYAVEEAQAKAEARDVEKLEYFAETDPKVVMWRMKCKYPKHWGDKQQVNTTIEHSGEINNNLGLDDGTIKEIAELIMDSKKNESDEN